ncbi:MAG: hypothetical protein DDT22_01308 [candidate division WS2 bacterium]|nr:hypothetical protein [Candidatus Lithacetigena glycinireducens]
MNNYIISFGAGVNSVAMTIQLFRRGEIYPIIFADTMAEHPETYCYMDYFEKEFIAKYGEKIIRLHPIENNNYHLPYARKPLEQYLLEKQRVPAVSKGRRACTGGWKREPIEKWIKKHCKGAISLIAFSLDEKHRGKPFPNRKYPLIESKIDREGCKRIIRKAGLKIPIKSGCFFCSFKQISDWERLYQKYPDLYERAMKIEENNKQFQKGVCLRPAGVSLRVLKERFQTGNLFDYDFEELTPCECVV